MTTAYVQPQMWPAVPKVLGQPELTEDARFKTADARWNNRTELDAIIAACTTVMRLMGDAGVPCGACHDTGEVLADHKARDDRRRRLPTRGTYHTVDCPIKLSDSPVAVSRPPLLGASSGSTPHRASSRRSACAGRQSSSRLKRPRHQISQAGGAGWQL